jgi:hypothetical protein
MTLTSNEWRAQWRNHPGIKAIEAAGFREAESVDFGDQAMNETTPKLSGEALTQARARLAELRAEVAAECQRPEPDVDKIETLKMAISALLESGAEDFEDTTTDFPPTGEVARLLTKLSAMPSRNRHERRARMAVAKKIGRLG